MPAPRPRPGERGQSIRPVYYETHLVSAPTTNGRRGSPPPIARGLAIDRYSRQELADLAAWVQSDGRLRTDDEIRDEMVQVLGYERRGPRIRERLQAVIADARRRGRF